MRSELLARAEAIFAELDTMSMDERVETLNALRLALHRHSPFADEPVDCIVWVRAETVAGNDYNPNTVAPPEMRLLERSIRADGYTQPIVTFPDSGEDGRAHTVIDGFHRTRVGKECREVRERLHGYLPITAVKTDRIDIKDRMAATIRHNRARGVHGVLPMTDIVASLIRAGWSDTEVAKELGMDADEVLRFKQVSGLPELFKNHSYSRAWE
ncbi:MAG: ParB/RepB/Spo0J family partition protein [Zoogloeaceae bacterium]|jgi:ParB-like chromosome segregation protein Spo0J|nr:ParB/RepB/Spo0J family partition protein [Zoogloeaceae bacterium]